MFAYYNSGFIVLVGCNPVKLQCLCIIILIDLSDLASGFERLFVK